MNILGKLHRSCDRLPKTCIILPVLNERENILPLLDGIQSALQSDYVVCIVDDGSTDGTRDLLEKRQSLAPEKLHVIYRQKKGHGSQRGSALYISLLWGLEETD